MAGGGFHGGGGGSMAADLAGFMAVGFTATAFTTAGFAADYGLWLRSILRQLRLHGITTGQPYTQIWYYCPNPAGYYPYVTQCYARWQTVPAS